MHPVHITRLTLTLLTALALSAGVSNGATWYVDDDRCQNDPSAGEEDNPFCTITYAISQAGAGDLILVEDGEYGYTDFGSTVVTVQSRHGADNCIINCSNETGVRFRTYLTSGSVLDGFKIINGGVHAVHLQGGARPTIRNCIFRGNDADDAGAAVYGVAAGPVLENCEFINNESYGFGAAVYMTDSGETVIKGCSFVGNRCTHTGDSSGAAILLARTFELPMSVLIQDCVFAQNYAAEGGAVAILGVEGVSPEVTIDSCLFEQNDSGVGGAMLLASCDPLVVTNTMFVDNASTGSGGAVYVEQCPFAQFLDCAVTGNTAGLDTALGGGLVINQAYSHTVFLTNMLIAGNTASAGGGVYATGGNVHITNSLILSNTTGASAAQATGGGISVRSAREVRVRNCTVAGNSGNDEDGVGGIYTREVEAVTAVTNSIFWGNTPTQMSFANEQDPEVSFCDVEGGVRHEWGTGNMDADPLFEDVIFARVWSENDYHLAPDSPCIDAGSTPLVAPDTPDMDNDGDTTEYMPFDIEGGFRIADSREVEDTGQAGAAPYTDVVDMGAYEMASFCVGEELPPPLDIVDRVDYAETVGTGGINPPTGAFYHACIPATAGGTACARSAIIAAEERALVTITWKYKENPEDWVYQEWPMTYRTGRCVADAPPAYHVSAVKFFKSYPEATVTLADYYDITVHLNGVISDNATVNELGEVQPGNPDLSILAGGEVNVADACPDGRVVVQYDQYEGGPLVGLEVVQVTSEGAALYAGAACGRGRSDRADAGNAWVPGMPGGGHPQHGGGWRTGCLAPSNGGDGQRHLPDSPGGECTQADCRLVWAFAAPELLAQRGLPVHHGLANGSPASRGSCRCHAGLDTCRFAGGSA